MLPLASLTSGSLNRAGRRSSSPSTAGSPSKAKAISKKQVPLTFNTLESYYRRGYIIGKRFDSSPAI